MVVVGFTVGQSRGMGVSLVWLESGPDGPNHLLYSHPECGVIEPICCPCDVFLSRMVVLQVAESELRETSRR